MPSFRFGYGRPGERRFTRGRAGCLIVSAPWWKRRFDEGWPIEPDLLSEEEQDLNAMLDCRSGN